MATSALEFISGSTVETAGSIVVGEMASSAGSQALAISQVPVISVVAVNPQVPVSIHCVPVLSGEYVHHRTLGGYASGSSSGREGVTQTYP